MPVLPVLPRLLLAVGLSVLAAGFARIGEAVAADARPNFILITLDDAGMQLSSYGDDTVQTPNLDGIAKEGVRFTNGYITQSSCSSSRSSMFTGLYTHQNGQIGLANRGFSMSQAFPTIPTILRQAGYRTGVIGKVHVQPSKAFSWTYKSPYLKWQWGTRDVRNVAAEARKFFDGGGPFFLKVSYLDPHETRPDQVLGIPPSNQLLTAKDITVNTWTGKPVVTTQQKQAIATYYNCIKRIDIGIGMLLDALEQSGKAGNTMVIVLGDNGGGSVQLGKADIYESGLRVPFLVRFPQIGPAHGQVRDELISSVDILPTILDAAGVAVPQPTKSMMTEGRSFVPIIRGESVPNWRRYLFAEMEYHNEHLFKPSRSVRDERYKLIRSYPPLNRGVNNLLLFDLKNDRLEKTNLVANASYKSTRDRLLGELSAWQARSDDFRH